MATKSALRGVAAAAADWPLLQEQALQQQWLMQMTGCSAALLLDSIDFGRGQLKSVALSASTTTKP